MEPRLPRMLPKSFFSHGGLRMPSVVPGCRPPSSGGSSGHQEQADWARQEEGGCLHPVELEVKDPNPGDRQAVGIAMAGRKPAQP